MSDHARNPLDQQIDRVAARLVSVDHHDAIVKRIVAGLPERNQRSGWLAVLAPQAALAAALIVAAVVWTTREHEQDIEPLLAPLVAGVTALEGPVQYAPVPGSGAPVAPRLAARRVIEGAPIAVADHERSLAPIDAPVALEVAALASPSLPDEAFVVLAPIVLTELPLSGEAISPR